MTKHLPLAALAALLLGAGWAPSAAAQAPQLDPATESVARAAMMQLRSPVTPFHTLDMCPDAGAAALRDTVMMAAAAGMSTDEIVEDVIDRRGEQLRIVPQRSGVGLWAWIGTPAVLLLGLGLIWNKLRHARGRDAAAEASGPATPALSAEERARLDAAMREYESAEETP